MIIATDTKSTTRPVYLIQPRAQLLLAIVMIGPSQLCSKRFPIIDEAQVAQENNC